MSGGALRDIWKCLAIYPGCLQQLLSTWPPLPPIQHVSFPISNSWLVGNLLSTKTRRFFPAVLLSAGHPITSTGPWGYSSPGPAVRCWRASPGVAALPSSWHPQHCLLSTDTSVLITGASLGGDRPLSIQLICQLSTFPATSAALTQNKPLLGCSK